MLVAALTLGVSSAFAENKHDIDIQLGTATPPAESTLPGGVALGFGYTYHYSDNIGIRFDATVMEYLRSDTVQSSGTSGTDIKDISTTYSRVPFFLGGRYYFGATKSLSFFGEAGYDISKDTVVIKTVTTYGGIHYIPSTSTSVKAEKDNSGLAVGAGLKWTGDSWFTGLSARYHAVTNPNSTVVLILGYSF